MKKVYIVAAKRTAIGKFLGSLSSFGPAELGAKVIAGIVKETGISPDKIDSVIVGNILSAGHMQGVARQCSVKAGIPVEVPAYSLNMVCGSGMKAVMNGCADIITGTANIVIAGGTESMSNAAFVMPGGAIRNGVKMGNITTVDHMICDGLTDAFNNYHMGITAENIAEKYAITREEQDAFAYSSQQKATKSVDTGLFDNEIIPVEIVTKKETIVFDKDEYPNRSTSPEKLGALRPAFKKDGTVTAGNASGVNDGASFVMLASEEAVKEYGLKPLAEIVAYGQGGVDPSIMGMGPVPAIRQALKNAGMKLEEIELLELNEAFAAQSLGVIKELISEHKVSKEWIEQRCNINGGAIALGHPIGASGNRILVTLVHLLKSHNKKLGLASLCIGGGMGTAIIIKAL
ncbi:MAG: acetyl-CoA acetyltransferase [Bacteroidetes bacterium GWE2_39_28]|nr:MAG: acetyl-CoA acetyltransferase [Bacteroidetes bacterium GWE2_39_28]OFY15311.1 MAG: acetyl-CoA acetyltransferase [Bacteroidetes bacterium GWF2_39_10]OFZ11158.1 MAG: acetyl-CoA acetyltransferase [Bacteroidetes bacterium RIFOXYC2_FULL_39_11]HCT93948.1 acetyl-CoA C-acyltransferase [Rikenellaceae bacterium]HCV16332.1 acetyl-CoA C-acyltransferase [Rikenellaceae bacterium]